jgi:hypothetical protein
MSRRRNLQQPIDGYLTISVRFSVVANFDVDYPVEERYTTTIEVNVLCEQIPTKTRNSSKACVYSRAFFIPILKGDTRRWTTE